jgi:phosphoribosylglycinamide formyltransferase-1
MKKIVVMASGNGSNFESIVNHLGEKVEITMLTDNKNSNAINRAKRLKIPYKIIDRKDYDSNAQFSKEVFELLKSLSPNLIVLAGYMRIIPDYVVEYFKEGVVNIHPSLLPAFKGKNAIEKAFDYGVKYTGITIHYIDEKIDHGKIIDQEVVKIEDGMTLDELERRIHEVEHSVYPKIIENILGGKYD